jgi:sodium-dependent dicarboxylate transporter 2/3/5
MSMGLPLVFILIPVIGFVLTRKVKSKTKIVLPQIGAWRTEEIRTLMVFGFIACAWVFRKAPFGGWSEILSVPNATDADVALLGVVLMFLIPNGEGKGERLLEWKNAARIPWGILLLFSGGLVIASGFKESGLSSALATQLAGLIQFHPYLLILCICLAVTFITEVTSNTASTLLLLPILAQTALTSDLIEDPRIIMIPATLSASCAFMLPVATAPNAIIYGSEKLSIKDMAREGVILNIGIAFIISGYFYLFYA